jgi:hypothetical protein
MKLQKKLNNIKNESFTIIIEQGIEEILFTYLKDENAIMVKNLCHYSQADYYKTTETSELITLYGEFETLLN